MGKNKITRVRRTFTPQFKRDAVKLVNEGKSVTEVARDLGIARSLLQRWRDQARDGIDAERRRRPTARSSLVAMFSSALLPAIVAGAHGRSRQRDREERADLCVGRAVDVFRIV
jgi:transposase-like protein